jgi:beta-N-acetylhexosaminidase
MVLITAGCGPSVDIVNKPISFSEERVELTKEYIQHHYDKNPDDITIEPKIIVLHWTAINSFDSSFAVFNRETLQGSRPDLEGAGQVNVSIHFLVDRDGTIHRLMPETIMARHCIGLNYNSIGVENVGGAGSKDNMTDDQIQANIELVRYLKEKFPQIEYLIGHHEYREFEGHPLWLETDENYRTDKVDPGKRFMNAVRQGVSDLNLKGVDEIRKEVKQYSNQ